MMVLVAAKQLPRTHQGGRPLKSDNRQFTYSEVVSITNNFQKVVGKGGFGTVYHGCLSDGMQVAVKMLSPSSTDGSMQFLIEVCYSTPMNFNCYQNECSKCV